MIPTGGAPDVSGALASVRSCAAPLEVVLACDPDEPGARRAARRAGRACGVRVRMPRAGAGPSWIDGAVEAARGEWLSFLPAGDAVPAGSYEAMLDSLAASGSVVALGVQVDVRGNRRVRVPWGADVLAEAGSTTLLQRPGLIVDLAPTGKVVRRDRWRAAGTVPTSWAGASATVARVLLDAGGIDVLDEVVHERHDLQTSLRVEEQDRFRPDLLFVLCSAWGEVAAALTTEPAALREAWQVGLLEHLLPGCYLDAVGGGPAYADVLLPWVTRLLGRVPTEVLARVPLPARLGARAAGTGQLGHLALALDHLADHPDGLPTAGAGADGQLAVLPDGLAEALADGLAGVPAVAWRRVEEVDRRLHSRVTVTPAGPGRWVLAGAAFVEYADEDRLPVVGVSAPHGAGGGELAVRRDERAGLDGWAARAHEDHDRCGFVADPAPVALPGPGPWRVRVELDGRSSGHLVPAPVPVPRRQLLVSELSLEGDALVAVVTETGAVPARAPRLRLSGSRAVTGWSTHREAATDLPPVCLPLLVDQFGVQALLPPGDYRLESDLAAAGQVGLGVPEPVELVGERVRLLLRAGGSGVKVTVSSPPAGAARSARGQQRLREEVYCGRVRADPPRTTVLLETFRGRSTGDNPGAVGRALATSGRAREHALDLAVVVDDPSVVVPTGTRAVPRRTPQWYAALSEADLLVSNAGAPYWFAKAPGQVHVQTWHGTPLKRIGEDRGPGDFATWRHRRRMAAQARGWDAMVSPSPYVTEIYRSAFGFDGTVLEVGYPRNDVLLAAGAGRHRAEVRARLGLPETERVVLYAPTWREYVGVRDPKPMYLDPEQLVAGLSDTVVLVRGHYNSTHLDDVFARHPRIHDVTRYPDIADLFLASDALVTDYSSVMFDFVLTDRPQVLLVPDLEQYRDVERGFYFDIETRSPGPLVCSTAEVVDVLAGPDDRGAERAEFRDAFCPFEDGHAADRVVDYCLDRLEEPSS